MARAGPLRGAHRLRHREPVGDVANTTTDRNQTRPGCGRATGVNALMSNVVGYARVSTREQNPHAQTQELRDAGASRVFTDHGESSRTTDRPQWHACLDYLRPGDTLLVRRLDRIAGSEKMAIEAINDLHTRGVNIKSLSEPDIDTTTPMGKALFGIVAVFAQLRVDTIRDNTMRRLA